jgi:7-carboxy-7-deazaguanine synthase
VKISEIFYSVQGEGMLVGVPSVFVRTSGCNLRCVWCDTPYTSWSPEGQERSIREILDDVQRYPARHVVVTGGEPMIAPEIAGLTEGLAGLGLHITVETAGTVFAPVTCHLMSISPKLANSTPWDREGGRWARQHERLRVEPGVVMRLMECCEYQLKFVVARPEDLAEIRSIVERTGAAQEKVVLMPEGTDAGVLRERGVWLIEIAKREGFRFSPRLHIELYGNRRGV